MHTVSLLILSVYELNILTEKMQQVSKSKFNRKEKFSDINSVNFIFLKPRSFCLTIIHYTFFNRIIKVITRSIWIDANNFLWVHIYLFSWFQSKVLEISNALETTQHFFAVLSLSTVPPKSSLFPFAQIALTGYSSRSMYK